MYFVLTRLWRYLNLYFLKPFDAINDTLTARLVYPGIQGKEYVELGSGDGVYSAVMHGGAFPLSYDRYRSTDLKRTDIYDVHQENLVPRLVFKSSSVCKLALDARESHVRKIREIGFAREAVHCPCENLPLPSGSVSQLFYYTPHGFEDHDRAMAEAHRILSVGGSMVVLRFDQEVTRWFVFDRLKKIFRGKLGAYFDRLSGGRLEEISQMAKTEDDWRRCFIAMGFEILSVRKGLSGLAWSLYDTQTRPVLKPLIAFFNAMPSPMRAALKWVVMVFFYPLLVLLYVLTAQDWLKLGRSHCYLAFDLVKKH